MKEYDFTLVYVLTIALMLLVFLEVIDQQNKKIKFMKEMAIERNCASYNSTTSEFEWSRK